MRHFLLLFVLLLVWSVPLVAQTTPPEQQDSPDSQTIAGVFYNYDTGARFAYPELWRVAASDASVAILSEDVTLVLFDFPAVQRVGFFTDSTPLLEVLRQFVGQFFGVFHTFDASRALPFTLDGRPALRYDLLNNDNRDAIRIFAVDFSDTGYGLLVALSESGRFSEVQAANIERIATTFNNPLPNQPVALNIDFEVPPGQAPCLLQAPGPQQTRLRLGPGVTRSVLRFLPADDRYPADAQIFLADGTRWYRLEMAALPFQVNSDELWTSSTEVTTLGDCVNLPDFYQEPPPAARPVVAQGEVRVVEAADPNVPNTGLWSLQYGASSIECEGDTPDPPDTPAISTQTAVNVAADGSFIVFNQQRFERVEEGVYLNSFDLLTVGGTVIADFRLEVENRTRMTGSITFDYLDGENRCVGTTPITMQQ